MKAIDLVVSTKQYMNAKGSNWDKLGRLQVDLIRWLRNEKENPDG